MRSLRRSLPLQGVIQLHALVLAAFAAAWLWSAAPHGAMVEPALLARMQEHARQRSPTMSIKLHFFAMDAVILQRLAPAALQRDATVALRAALRKAARDALPGHARLIRWRVDRRTRGITPGQDWARQGAAAGKQAPLGLRMNLRIYLEQTAEHARRDGPSSDPALSSQMHIDAQGTTSVRMRVSDSSAVGAALMNGSRAALHTLALELVAGSSAFAAPQPPPSRVNLGLVTSALDPPVIGTTAAGAKTAWVMAMRSRLERMLRRVWGRAAPPVASHILSTSSGLRVSRRSVDSRDGRGRGCGPPLTHEAAGDWIRAFGAMPSIASSQPLSLVLYDAAHLPEQPCTAFNLEEGDARPPFEDKLLANGSAVVIPGQGGLLVWGKAPGGRTPSQSPADAAADGTSAGAASASGPALARVVPSGLATSGSDGGEGDALIRLVRTLLGPRTFPPPPGPVSPFLRMSSGDQHGGVGAHISWLEATALQVSCAQAELRSASAELHALHAAAGASPTLASPSDIARVRAAAERAVGMAEEAAHRLEGGDARGACEAAQEAHRLMLWASRHESLLPGQEMPLDAALAAYAPLFLPVSITVLSAARSSARSRSKS
jgi:hypothetical protein